MPEDRHYLIAGAGIGGLAAALFLGQAGFRVTLCDREPELKEFGAGVQLSPNASRILAKIGVLADLDDFAVEPEAINIHRARDGQRLARAKLGKTALARFGVPFLNIHRGDLQRALLNRARQHARITIRLGLRLTDIRPSEEIIEAIFEGGSGETTRIAADALIGADGLWSRARALAGLPGPARYSGQTAWRALVPREQAPLFAREYEVNLWLGPSAHLVHYPVCGGREINIVAIIDDEWREEGWSAAGDPDLLAAKFTGWHRKARDLVASAETWSRWALLDHAPDSRWSRPRLTLLGDAAHPMVPFLAQGASQALEDAQALAQAMSRHAGDGRGLAAAFAAYERERIPRTARIQKEARRQGRFYHLSGLSAAMRDLAISALPGSALLERYAWIYDHGRTG